MLSHHAFVLRSSAPILVSNNGLFPREKLENRFLLHRIRFPVCKTTRPNPMVLTTLLCTTSDRPLVASKFRSNSFQQLPISDRSLEEDIEKAIYGFRFFAFLAVWGSLVGSALCFIKGCYFVMISFREYFLSSGKMILMLIEAIYVYLLGTVMLVFGMGLYELFISNLNIGHPHLQSIHGETATSRSDFFGFFRMMERPKWLEIQSVNELKTKVGHVIVIILLVGLVEKSKTVIIGSSADLLCFAASILLCSICLYLLSRLGNSKSVKNEAKSPSNMENCT